MWNTHCESKSKYLSITYSPGTLGALGGGGGGATTVDCFRAARATSKQKRQLRTSCPGSLIVEHPEFTGVGSGAAGGVGGVGGVGATTVGGTCRVQTAGILLSRHPDMGLGQPPPFVNQIHSCHGMSFLASGTLFPSEKRGTPPAPRVRKPSTTETCLTFLPRTSTRTQGS